MVVYFVSPATVLTTVSFGDWKVVSVCLTVSPIAGTGGGVCPAEARLLAPRSLRAAPRPRQPGQRARHRALHHLHLQPHVYHDTCHTWCVY